MARDHRVTFYSPGTLVDESTTRPIAAWDPVEAVRMAAKITERHGAKPYGFQFSTVIVHPEVEDVAYRATKIAEWKAERDAFLHPIGGAP